MGPKAGGRHTGLMPLLELKEAGGLRGLCAPWRGRGLGLSWLRSGACGSPFLSLGPAYATEMPRAAPPPECTCSGSHPWARRGLLPGPSPLPSRPSGGRGYCGQRYLELEFQLSLEAGLLTLDGHPAAQFHGHGTVQDS